MLSPDNRHLFIDAFRPPEGMGLESAVGTTFTLDLDALLLAPVALAMHSFEADGSADSLALLESVRRYADRITLFCLSLIHISQHFLEVRRAEVVEEFDIVRVQARRS